MICIIKLIADQLNSTNSTAINAQCDNIGPISLLQQLMCQCRRPREVRDKGI